MTENSFVNFFSILRVLRDSKKKADAEASAETRLVDL